MKTILFLIIALQLSVYSASAQFSKVELQAAGLTCSMCSRAVDKQLHTLDFIDSVGVDLSQATFIIYLKKDKPVDFNQIKKKVEDAGFSVASLKTSYRFNNFKVDKNSSFSYNHMTFYFLNAPPQTLNGMVPLKIMGKGFTGPKEYKKYAAQLTAPATGTNTYHVLL